jgi:hypothetical protein
VRGIPNAPHSWDKTLKGEFQDYKISVETLRQDHNGGSALRSWQH